MSEPIQRPGLFGVRVKLLFVALACVIVSLFVFNWLMLRQFDSKESTAKLQEVNSSLQKQRESYGRNISQWMSTENELQNNFLYEMRAGTRNYLQKKIALADLDYIILVSKKPDLNTKKPYSIFEHAFRDESQLVKAEDIVAIHLANPKQLVERDGLLGFTEEVLVPCAAIETDEQEVPPLSAKDEGNPKPSKDELKKCVAGYLLVGMKPAHKVAIDLLRPDFFKVLTPISISVIVLLVVLFLFVPLRVKLNVRV